MVLFGDINEGVEILGKENTPVANSGVQVFLPDAAIQARYGAEPVLVIPLRGTATVGGEAVSSGQCGLAASLAELGVPDDALVLIAQPLVQA